MDVNRVKNTTIFHGMSEKEIADALEGLNAVTKKYKKLPHFSKFLIPRIKCVYKMLYYPVA